MTIWFISKEHRARMVRCSLGLVGAGLMMSGCGSPPAAHVHSLLGPDTVPRREAPQPKNAGAFILESISLPTSVDQPQWLVRLPDDSLASLESERWASPLRDELRQALLVQWVNRFGLVDARDDRAFSATAWRVRIDVLRFESIAGREARIEGTWTLTAPAPAPKTMPTTSPTIAAKPATLPISVHCNWRFAQPVASGMAAMAEAHRVNTMHLANAVGEMLTQLQRGETARCADGA